MFKALPYAIYQGPVVRALGRAIAQAARLQVGRPFPPLVPTGDKLVRTVPPRAPELIAAYQAALGSSATVWRGHLPAHMFPQFAFPLFIDLMRGLDYPILKGLNGGCRLEQRAPLPLGVPLELTGWIDRIDANDRRVIIHECCTIGTASTPDAVRVDFRPLIPLGGPRSKGGTKKPTPTLPEGARLLEEWQLTAADARAFALLTGDLNPIHWLKPYAQISGFKNTILHGYATMGRAIEGLARHLWGGDPRRLSVIDMRFTRPLVLPRKVGLYATDDGQVIVTDDPAKKPFMIGTFEAHA